MADETSYTPLPADLPEDWTLDQTIAPAGADVGLSEQHGYNYLMKQVNAAQRGVNAASSAARELQDAVAKLEEDKQDKLHGSAGQVVGFDGDGNAVAQEPPPSGFFPQIIVEVAEGAAVTCAQGGTSFQQTAGAEPVVFTVTDYGTWTLSAEKDGRPSNTVEVAVDAARQYHAALTFFAATITVTVEAGSTVTCAKGADVQTAVSVGAVTFMVHETGTYTITAEKDGQTAEKAVEITADGQVAAVKLAYVHIYGATWDGTSTTKWTRTDDAALFTDPVPYVAGATEYGSPFDDLMPWAGMVRVSDPEAGELVAIPKFWYKLEQNTPGVLSSGLLLKIADHPADGFRVSPAHMDRGDGKGERGVVYVGRYHCDSEYKSTTNNGPIASISKSDARSGIHNLGETIWQFDYAMRETIWMLYLVEFADWNSQQCIGYGCSATGNKAAPNGETDTMNYHTGTTATDRITYSYTQYRNIEGLWDNVLDWLDGCYHDDAKPYSLYIINNPALFQDNSGGVFVGSMPSGGYITAFNVSTVAGLEWVFYPSGAANGWDDTYITDTCSAGGNGRTAIAVGGYYQKNLTYGLFHVYTASPNPYLNYIGCRLMKLPNPGEEAV